MMGFLRSHLLTEYGGRHVNVLDIDEDAGCDLVPVKGGLVVAESAQRKSLNHTGSYLLLALDTYVTRSMAPSL